MTHRARKSMHDVSFFVPSLSRMVDLLEARETSNLSEKRKKKKKK